MPCLYRRATLKVGYIGQQTYAGVDPYGRINRVVPWQSVIAQIKRRPGFAEVFVAEPD